MSTAINFERQNIGWNAEPNAPYPNTEVVDRDLLLTFYVNPYQYPRFHEDEIGILRFLNCTKYRVGPTNDEGWYRGQCRFSELAPGWGEFYEVTKDAELLNAPNQWRVIQATGGMGKHYLFYFRDVTFECIADGWKFEPGATNALNRLDS